MVSIADISEVVMFKILNKLTNWELIEMRKTCSRIDSVAETHRKELASRPSLGTNLVIEDYLTKRNEYLFFGTVSNADTKVKVDGDKYEKHLSGISFKRIHVDIIGKSQRLRTELKKFFDRIQPICEKFSTSKLTSFPLDFICPLTNSLAVREEIDLTYAISDMKDYDAKEVMSTLKKAKNSSLFCLPPLAWTNRKILKNVKHFSRVRLFTNKKCFYELLRDIQNSATEISMQSIFIDVENEYGEPIHSLFNSPHLPTFQIYPNTEKYEKCKFFRVMSLSSQYVVVHSNRKHNSEITIYFIEKSPSAQEQMFISIFGHSPIRVYKDEFKDIPRLSNYLTSEILKKMEDRELTGMRKTCSQLNFVATTFEKKLAMPPFRGTTLNVKILEDDTGIKNISMCIGGSNEKITEEDLAEKIPNIAFRSVCMYLNDADRNVIDQLVALFTRLRLKCKSLSMYDFTLETFEYAVPLTDLFAFQQATYNFTRHFQDFDAETVISTLSQSRNRSKFRFTCPGSVVDKVFEKVTQFYYVDFSTSRIGFHELLWGIYNSKDEIKMDQIRVRIENVACPFDSPNLPPFQLILLEKLEKTDIICLFTLPSQFLFIQGYNQSFPDTWSFNLYFLEKSMKAVEKKMTALYRPYGDFETKIFELELKSILSSVVI